MKNLSDINVVKSLLSRHGFQFSKALGQNFLINPEICPKMAIECGADQTKGVIEVGPGFGVLTRELAARANKVVAIELDKRLPAVLAETLRDFDNVKVVQADVMEVDLHQLIQDEFSGLDVLVCANLPYYITSPVIMKLLEEKLPVESLTVMVQKEAAVRICAAPGTRACGAVSVAVQYYSQPQILFDVPRDCFFPCPKCRFGCDSAQYPQGASRKIRNRRKTVFQIGKSSIWTTQKDSFELFKYRSWKIKRGTICSFATGRYCANCQGRTINHGAVWNAL